MERIIKNTKILIVFKTIIAVCGFLSTSLITRYLGAFGYSQYSYIFSLGINFYIFADFGLSINLIRSVARKTYSTDLLHNTLAARLLLSVVSFILMIVYVSIIGQLRDMYVALILIGLYQALQMLSLTHEAYLQGAQDFLRALVPQVTVAVLSLIGVVFTIMQRGTMLHIFFVMLCAQAMGLWMYMYFNHTILYFRYDFKKIYTLIRAYIPLALGVMLASLYFKIDVVILGFMFPPLHNTAVGIYAVSYKWFEISIVFSGYIIQALFPYFSSIQEKKILHNAVKKYFIIIASISVCVAVGIFAFAPFLVEIIGGSEFSMSAQSLRILSLAIVPTLIGGYFTSIILSLKKDMSYLVIGCIAVILNVALNIIYIPQFSYIATSWNTVITQLCIMCGYGVILYSLVYKDQT